MTGEVLRPWLDERFGSLDAVACELDRVTPPVPRRRGRYVDGPASTRARCAVLIGKAEARPTS